jgi:hypothetical protein
MQGKCKKKRKERSKYQLGLCMGVYACKDKYMDYFLAEGKDRSKL